MDHIFSISLYWKKGNCKPYNYWNIASSNCIAQKLDTESCLSNGDCLSLSGLYCSTTCKCQSNYYWLSASKLCCMSIKKN